MRKTFPRSILSYLLALQGALFVSGCGSSEPAPHPTEAQAPLATEESDLYVDTTALWASPLIDVCWENATATNATERAWVRDAVSTTWAKVSVVSFVGWEPCTSTSRGIRISIADVGPHVKTLGARLDGRAEGMVLNFTFVSWGDSCQYRREYCIRAIAVHEFGHALGFAHEQNRPDRPSTCTEPAQGSNGNLMIGAWDLSSVMNYCNPDWNGNGQLSATDIAGVVQLYGKPVWLHEFGYTLGGWRVEQHDRTAADVNGDGRADIVGFANDGVRVSLSTGTGLSQPQLWLADFGYINGGWRVEMNPRTVADVNGDGRADIVGFGNDGVRVALSTGTGFGAAQRWLTDFGYYAGDWRVEMHPRTAADINGDGRADIIGFGHGGVSVALSTGTGFSTPQLWLGEFGYNAGGWRVEQHPRMAADINGDGRADIIGFANDGVRVSLSTGTGLTPPQLWLAEFGAINGGWRVDMHPRTVADINGDGRADIIGFANEGVRVALSTGTGLSSPQSWLADFGYYAGDWRVERHVRTVADMTGDRRADIVGFSDVGVRVHRN